MAEKQGRLAKILEDEYKSKGLVSGAVAAGSKRIKEMFDLRNVLFSGSGLKSVIGRKIFGKGYTATPDSTVASKISAAAPGFSSESIDVLISIKKDTRISAKNSMVLPSMARDMNLMRQNISRLVKLQGGTASTKADMFFKRAGERESAYEAQFAKKVEPVQVVKTETKKDGANAGILAGLIAAFAGISSAVGGGLKSLSSVVSGVSQVLSSVLQVITAIAASIGVNKLFNSLRPGTASVPSPTQQTTKPTPGQTPTKQEIPKSSGGRGIRGKASQRFGNVGAGGLSVGKNVDEGKVIQKINKILKSPKSWAKFAAFLTKRGFAWIVTALAFTGPVGWVIGAILAVWSASEFISLIDEFLKDDTSPTNLKEEQTQMANLIYDRFREAGFDDNQARAAVANAVAESALNPNAHNEKGEDSVGLFQMNRKGGLGEGYSVEQLKDPETNIALAIDAAKKSKNFVNASSVEEATEAFVRDVERPKDKAGAIAKRTQIALDMQSSNLGSKVNSASTEIASANRELTTSSIFLNAPTNNNVQNNNNVQSGGSPAEVFNNQFNELLRLSLSQT